MTQKTCSYRFISTWLLASTLFFMFSDSSAHATQSCGNIKPLIEVIDESGGTGSVNTSDGLFLKKYVDVISKNISEKVCEAARRQKSITDPPQIKLYFVYRPLIAYKGVWNNSSVFDNLLLQNNISRFLDSPWARITVSYLPKPIVSGVFLWNERQFLFDQALISGIDFSPPKKLLPINEIIFFQYVQDYVDSVLRLQLPPLPEHQKVYSIEQLIESNSAAQARFSKRAPADIFWLFRSSIQTTRGPFAGQAGYALELTIANAAGGYTDLTNILVNQFFASTDAQMHYKNVFDMKKHFSLDKYRLKPPY